MEDEGLISLEKRVASLEKALGVVEDDVSPTKVKFEPNSMSLISKLQFIDYKTKEIYLSQIQNVIEKGYYN